MMDNLYIEKIWHDEEILEIKIRAISEFVDVWQKCYISEKDLIKNAECILAYIAKPETQCYVEYGKKTGNYTPAFSMCIFPIDVHGHMKIEMDIEINDNNSRSHRCLFYIESELGLVEQFATKMVKLSSAEVGFGIELAE